MHRRAIPMVLLSIGALFLGVASADNQEISELESNFSSTKFRIIHEVAEIPRDVQTKLYSVTGAEIADFGEQWNSTDLLYPGAPTAQHLFTGVTDAIAAVAFRTGGFGGATLRLLLTKWQADWFCLYDVLIPDNIADSMGSMQQLFPPHKASKLNCRRVDDT
ncbi:MAG: hypothetical protein U5K38_03750 [Woeseiaceae bacterium]|nr:hypothetical protein [Woeseiaceae bacterium]